MGSTGLHEGREDGWPVGVTRVGRGVRVVGAVVGWLEGEREGWPEGQEGLEVG